jgi:hypothetical protein
MSSKPVAGIEIISQNLTIKSCIGYPLPVPQGNARRAAPAERGSKPLERKQAR